MDILIVVIVILIIIVRIGSKTQKRKAFNKLSTDNKNMLHAKRKNRQQEDEELITVIIPTINHDGK